MLVDDTLSENEIPVRIVGIYLTSLDYVMAKVKLSNGCYINYKIADLKDLLPEHISDIPRDVEDWRFVPYCE